MFQIGDDDGLVGAQNRCEESYVGNSSPSCAENTTTIQGVFLLRRKSNSEFNYHVFQKPFTRHQFGERLHVSRGC